MIALFGYASNMKTFGIILNYCLSKDKGRAIDFVEMTMRPDFVDAIEKLRIENNIDKNFLLSGTNESEEELMDFLENGDSSIVKDVKDLLINLKISLSWQNIVYSYVFTGNCFPYNDESPEVINNADGLILKVDTDNYDKLILEIGKDTTMEEFKNSWDVIKKYRKMKPKRKKEKVNFLRDYKIFSLANDGKTIKEICNIIQKEFEIDNLDYGNIKKIVSSFYKRLKIPKKDRVKLITD